MVEVRNAYNILIGTREGKTPLGRIMRRWDDNIRTDLKVIGWKCLDWIHLIQYVDQ